MKAHPQRDVQKRGKRNDGHAGPDRHFEFEAEMHHQNGRELAEHREPAQPDQRIQPYITRAFVSPGQTEHDG